MTLTRKTKKAKKTRRTEWHSAFVAAMKLELKDYKEHLTFVPEYELTGRPKYIEFHKHLRIASLTNKIDEQRMRLLLGTENNKESEWEYQNAIEVIEAVIRENREDMKGIIWESLMCLYDRSINCCYTGSLCIIGYSSKVTGKS